MYTYQLADQVQTKWAYTDRGTVTYSITQHMMEVTPACLYLVYPNFHPCVFVYVFFFLQSLTLRTWLLTGVLC